MPRPGDAHLLYEHPDLLNYDPDFRPRQIEIREEELFEGLQYILQQSSPIRDIIDEKVVIVGGFSYGAATACLSVAKRKGVFVACYLLDGWFYIDLGGGTTFPAEAHEKGLDVPALFIGSEHFANWKSCASATAELSKKNSHPCGSSCHVIPGSRHQNFTDVGFWLSTWVLRKVNMIGPCDYLHQYQNVLKISTAFFNLHTKKPM